MIKTVMEISATDYDGQWYNFSVPEGTVQLKVEGNCIVFKDPSGNYLGLLNILSHQNGIISINTVFEDVDVI